MFANVLYAFYSASGMKLSEATVFSAAPSIQSRLILDHRDGARLGVAIANITDIARTYTITLTEGPNVKTTSITVPAQRSQAMFVDELLAAPSETVGILTIRSGDLSEFSAVGLRFTGTAFTTIPAN